MKFNLSEKSTLRLLIIGTFFNAFALSLESMQDIIAKRALGALDWQITVLVMLWPIASFFSIWWGKLLEQTDNKSKFFVWIALGGKLVLVAGLWISQMWHFLLLLGVVFFFNSLFIPTQNAVLQVHFHKEHRGKAFGQIIATQTFVILLVTLISGKILDHYADAYRYLFLVFGVLGCIGLLFYARIPFAKPLRHNSINVMPLRLSHMFLAPLKRTAQVFRKNREFALFELAFIVYGMGFLCIQPILPKYFVEIKELSYTHIFLAKSALVQFCMLLLTPFTGKFHDVRHPALFTGVSFGILAIYPILLLISSFMGNFNGLLLIYAAYIIFGIAMSGIIVSWNISSIFFAGEEDASMYQSVHVTLTGVRGLLAPALGLIVLKTLSYRVVFGMSSFFMILAAILCFRLYQRRKTL